MVELSAVPDAKRRRSLVALALAIAAALSGAVIGSAYVLFGVRLGIFVASRLTWWPPLLADPQQILFAAAFAIVLGGIPAAVISFLALNRAASDSRTSLFVRASAGPAVMGAFSLLPLAFTSPIYLVPIFAAGASAIGALTFYGATTIVYRRSRQRRET